jgi:hypothetical protein
VFASKHRFEVPDWNLKNYSPQNILCIKLNQVLDNLLIIMEAEGASLTP